MPQLNAESTPDAAVGALLFAVAAYCRAVDITDPDVVDQVMADLYTQGIPELASEAMTMTMDACSRVNLARNSMTNV